MDSALKLRIQEEMKLAMRARDTQRLGTIRLIMAAIKQKEVDERIELDDTQILAVLEKMLKQRRESIAQYETAGRMDLASKEAFEVDIITAYMPEALSEQELDALIDEAMKASGAVAISDMGKVMASLKEKVQGRADMRLVSEKIKQKLS